MVLTLLTGIVHGVIDGRWTANENKRARAEKFDQLPEKLGDWELTKKSELEESAAQILRPYGTIVRHYRHKPTGTEVNMALLYGRRGPIAVHRPEICYSSVGTRQTRKRSTEVLETENAVHSLWSVEFTRDATLETFEVWYGWSQGGEFVAAESPRFWLTEDLYKVQLSGPIPEGGFDPCESFVKELLPQLEQLVQ
ncbi:MAG: exosortase-associated EpsI family protein [Planctomycetota bacterium]